MAGDREPVVSAVVLLRAGSGGRRGTGEGGGSEASRFFATAGFEVGPVVGGSFSISGPESLFESTFGEPLEQDAHGAQRTARGTLELDLAPLPEDVTTQVVAVAFPRPPDFGPTRF